MKGLMLVERSRMVIKGRSACCSCPMSRLELSSLNSVLTLMIFAKYSLLLKSVYDV